MVFLLKLFIGKIYTLAKNINLALVLPILIFFINSCSLQKYIDKGDFQKTIEKGLKRIERKPNDVYTAQLVVEAFNELNRADLEEINKLNQLENPEKWESQYYAYLRIQNRQKKLQDYEVFNSMIAFNNVETNMREVQQKAADYHYQNALKYMQTGEKEDFQKAFAELQKTVEIFPSYQDTYSLMGEAKQKGMYQVLVTVSNPQNLALSPEILAAINIQNPKYIKETWFEYHTVYSPETYYDYAVNIAVTGFWVSKNQEKKTTYKEEKEIEEGEEMVKDKNGKPVLGPNGKPLTKKIVKTYSAQITQTTRTKESWIAAEISFTDNFTQNTFKRENLVGKYVWENISATYKGSDKALTNSTKAKVKTKLQNFPPYANMLQFAAQNLSKRAQSEIKSTQFTN